MVVALPRCHRCMTTDRHRVYRDVSFSTRAKEIDPGTTVFRRFTASYSIKLTSPVQKFTSEVFDTAAHAVAHASTLAKREIDLSLLNAGGA